MAILPVLRRHRRPIVALSLLGASALGLAEQANVPAAAPPAVPQISQRVSNSQRTTLPGNVRPLPPRAHDLGAVAPALPASRMLLLLKRPALQESLLRQFLTDAHTPGSPSYRQWLTPAQLGEQYGPADADVQQVEAWLQSQGLAVARVSPAKTSIEFSGTIGQVEHAFATQVHTFQIDGVTHYSNVTNPQIPSALAPVVAGLSPLNDFRPRPMHTAPAPHLAARDFSAPGAAATIQPRQTTASPQFTTTDGSYLVTPADLATIYDTPNSTLNRNYSAKANLTGSGVTIGIAGDSNVDLTNVANYRALFGLPALTPTVVIDGADPQIQGDNSVEALLDLEMASAVAPAANLRLYIAQDTTFQDGLTLAMQRALDENAVNILNVSFGACEAYLGASGNQQMANLWQQAAAQGISVTVSAGDSGSAGCDSADATQAAEGLEVNGLASTPYNIAVGGTDFNQTSTTAAQYWSNTNSSIGESALGFIPEIAWNNSTTTVGSLAGNVASRDSQGQTRIDGTGGGVSGCLNAQIDSTTGDVLSCSGAYAKPNWQSGFGTLTARQLPDVSLFAANGGHLSAYVLCASGLGGDNPGDVDCVRDATGSFNLQGVGGTSASAPAFAGMLALVIQGQSSGNTAVRLGQADFTLYPLAKQFPAAFHDVTAGNNSVYCAAGSLDCGSNSFLTGYDAITGFDMASGLGSVDATQMVQDWGSLTFKATTTALRLNGSTNALSLTHGTSVQVAASVTSTGGTPTGNVVLVNNNSINGDLETAVAAGSGATASPSLFTLTNGAAAGAYAYLPGGSYTVSADYSGDGTFAASNSNGIHVSVAAESSVLDLALLDFTIANNGTATSASNATLPYGTYVSVSAQPVGTSQASQTNPLLALATGNVAFVSTAPQLNTTAAIDSTGVAEIPGQLTLAFPPGVYTVSATYAGDSSFLASSAAAQTFTITKGSTAFTAPASGGASLAVEVDPNNATYYVNSGAALPTGTVTVANSAGTAVGTGTLAQTTNAQGYAIAVATVALNSALLTNGSNALTLTYTGDTNYNGNSAAVTYTLTAGGGKSFSLSAAPSTVSISGSGSGSSTVSVTPQSGFTGTVGLTCSVTSAGASTTLLPTCSFAQASVTVSGTAAVTDTLTVATTTSSSALHPPASPLDRTWYAAGGTALAGVLLLGLPGRRRAWRSLLSLCLLVSALGIAGCGGSSSHSTPAGSYTVTVTATSGSVSQQTTVAVTVN